MASVLSAHHGVCPKAMNAAYGERAARLFSRPLPYMLYKCIARTEAEVLADAGCARSAFDTIFITFAHPQHVIFGHDQYMATATFKTFGAQSTSRGDTVLYIPVRAFPKPPPPPGDHVKPYTGAPLYGLIGATGDPFDLQQGECAG